MSRLPYCAGHARYGEVISEVLAKVRRTRTLLIQIKELCVLNDISLSVIDRLHKCDNILNDFLKEVDSELEGEKDE